MKKILIILSLFVVSCPLWPQNNVITYTAWYQLSEALDPTEGGFYSGGFGVNVINHTFENGVGMITFSGEVTYVGSWAFSDTYYLTSVTLPNSVTEIDSWAFENSSGLTSIYIPESVTSIGDWAFYRCSGLTSISIPESVTRIGNNAFGGCSGLTSIIVEPENTIYDSRDSCNAIIETASNTLLFGCQNSTIPDGVTMICQKAFVGVGLSAITFPNSIESIGYFAFAGCESLTSVTIPNSVMYINNEAFRGCSGLVSIIVEGDNPNYDSRNNCNAIIETATNTLVLGCKNTIIPSSVTSIGAYAFEGCFSLTSITIPEEVTSIGGYAFDGCSNLMSINIPQGITSIDDYTFHGCSSLTSIDIPESVTSIGDWAFKNCSGLTSVTIPSSVTSIGDGAFYDCSGLTSIRCDAIVPPVLGSNVFWGVPRDIPLYVSAVSIPAYQAAEQWNEFDLFPLYVEVNTVSPNTTELTWNPVSSASLYQLHLYTDSTSSVALDTTLFINADSLNGGIMVQPGTSVARRVKKIVQDAGGTIIVITIDPTSGTSEENPYKVTVSTVSGERVDVHFDMTVYQGTEILREESGSFVLNEDQPDGIENLLVPSLPTGIYDLYGHRYTAEMWERLPAGVYVLRTEDRVEKVMK